ncbi:extracellular solute-binding protein family 1 [Paenibacillus terrae HPL-003]|uniref:Extracellular solute-binding protein family 1 n=2 Tax=Paenibacillus terrae TaxID=159743 RepID=G7VPN1_PAETH|nr:extracellular solute-binding protein family 1 [Paenibacillus terrae HPL-003]
MGTSLSADLDKAGINWDYTTSLTEKQGGTFAAADSLVMLRTAKNKELASELIKF